MFRGASSILAVAFVLITAGCGSPSGPSAEEGCPGTYPPQAVSAYVLPYEAGRTFVIGQGNCGDGSHARGSVVQYAYDFLMPIGTTVIAARAGEVLLVEERFADGTKINGQENYINIRHADGSIAAYVHLTINGALVMVGDRVAQGQSIGLSGDTGNSSAPHLHFHVQSCSGCPTEAVTFRNTRPHPRGLRTGESYAASDP
jgi:murein DD-endopeptidase MepM/ murein hydrolase activator NlpD